MGTSSSFTIPPGFEGQFVVITTYAVGANGTTVTTSSELIGPIEVPAPQNINIVIVGQSGQKYTFTGEMSSNFNRTGDDDPGPSEQYRPDLGDGEFGSMIEATLSGPAGSAGASVAAGTLIDRPINNTNFHTPSNSWIVSRGALSVAQFSLMLMPTRTPRIVILAESGTSMDQLMNDNENNRCYESYRDVLNYVRDVHGEIDVYCQAWFGSEPTGDDYGEVRSPQWFMQLKDGTPVTPGTVIDGKRVDHSVFDANTDFGDLEDMGAGTIPRRAGTLVAFGTLVGDSEARLDSLTEFLQSDAMGGMGMDRWHLVDSGGHTLCTTKYGQPIAALMILGEPILTAAGYTYEHSSIADIVPDESGDFFEVMVEVPAGHSLTTWRRMYNSTGDHDFEALSSPQVGHTAWQGFHITRLGGDPEPFADVGTGDIAQQVTWTLEDDGASSGTAVLRGTLEQPLVNGEKIGYRVPGVPSGLTDGAVDPNMPWIDRLIVHDPDLWDADMPFPFAGIQIDPMMEALTMMPTPIPPGAGDPEVLLTYTTGTDASEFETTTFVVPSEPGVLLALVAINSSINDDTTSEPVTHATFGTASRTQGTGTAMTSLIPNNNRTGRMVSLAYAYENPSAGTYTFQWAKSSGNSRCTVMHILWVPDAGLPVAQSNGHGGGGTGATITFTPTPTDISALSLYHVARTGAATATFPTMTELEQEAGPGGTGQGSGYVGWARHGSTSAQSAQMAFGATADRVGSYVELVAQ